jgi:long-chain acyl-CoA synthetase
MENQLCKMYNQSFRQNWDLPLFTDYGSETETYGDVAQSIATLQVIFERAGLKKGDKVAIFGRNSSNWGKIFLACVAYGAIAVPILPDFIPDNVHHILEHSGARFLFAGKSIFATLDASKITQLEGCVAIDDFSILGGSNGNLKSLSDAGLIMKESHPVTRDTFFFNGLDNENDLQVLSYTSGSSGFSKGVMIPVRSLHSNLLFAQEHMPLKSGDKIVSFLPMAHVFGLAFEFMFPVTTGCHLTFLTKSPSPQVLMKSLSEIHPHLVFAVPLIIEKIYKKKLLPTLDKPVMKVLLKIPGVNNLLYKKIRGKLIETFGGRFYELVIGGAALSAEVEDFFRKIKFPFTIGYGMTECGPLISYAAWDVTRKHSAGTLVDRLEIRIESEDPYNVVGEIQVKGVNVMLGYYNNDEANRNTFTEDGWLKTGDLGVIDKDNFVYIKGRSKNMLLGPSGQNIYPEELEARLANMPYVLECVVIQRDAKLVALVYPIRKPCKQLVLPTKTLDQVMADNRKKFNSEVASYEQLTKVEIVSVEFEKTPKRNIKRYLYT